MLLALLLTGCPGPEDPKPGDTAGDTAVLPDESGGFVPSNDCDEQDAAINPGAEELCDGIDNNCNDVIDEDVQNTYFRDWDGDGFGDPTVQTEACEPPTSYIQDSTDCDDTNADVWPGNTETCDGLDDDCDGAVDEDGVCG
jgi:hypothetical protein